MYYILLAWFSREHWTGAGRSQCEDDGTGFPILSQGQ